MRWALYGQGRADKKDSAAPGRLWTPALQGLPAARGSERNNRDLHVTIIVYRNNAAGRLARRPAVIFGRLARRPIAKNIADFIFVDAFCFYAVYWPNYNELTVTSQWRNYCCEVT